MIEELLDVQNFGHVILLAVKAGHFLSYLWTDALVDENEWQTGEDSEDASCGQQVVLEWSGCRELTIDLVDGCDEEQNGGVLVEVDLHELHVGVPVSAVVQNAVRNEPQIREVDVAELDQHFGIVDLNAHVRSLQHQDVVVPVAHCESDSVELLEEPDDDAFLERSAAVSDHGIGEFKDELHVFQEVQILRYEVDGRSVDDDRIRLSEGWRSTLQAQLRLGFLQLLELGDAFVDFLDGSLELRLGNVHTREVEVEVVFVFLAWSEPQSLSSHETLVVVVT